MREFWLSRKTVGLAIPLILAIAFQIGGWVNPAVAYVLFSASFVWLLVALVDWRRHKKEQRQPAVLAPAATALGLPDTLTAMHRRLVELQSQKASHTRIPYGMWRRTMPTLADRIGIVGLKDWRGFERSVTSRLRRALPRKNFERIFSPAKRFVARAKWKDEAHRVTLAVALELQDEYVRSADWTFDDAMKASNWLDGYDWGVRKLRDEDPRWQGLFQSLSTHLKDDVLCDKIQRHNDFSLVTANMRLLVHFSSKYKDDVFSIMLHEALVGSPISPDYVEAALAQMLSDIEKAVTRSRGQRGIVAGALVGKATGVKISGCSCSGKITVEGEYADVCAGGLIGEGKAVEIVDSHAHVEIEYRNSPTSVKHPPEHNTLEGPPRLHHLKRPKGNTPADTTGDCTVTDR